MRVFISGGCKNGKSTYAQVLARAQRGEGRRLYYIATMLPRDGEDEERVRRHRDERRGWGFETLEIPSRITDCLPLIEDGGSVLLDSATALLSNEMFTEDGGFDAAAGERVAGELHTLVEGLPNIVVVSDAIYSDALLYDEMTSAYRRALARIDRTLAACCDVVLEVCFGSLIAHKGGDLLGEAL